MFRCQQCNRTAERGTKMQLKVIETRPKIYEVKHKVDKRVVTKTYQGSEIVKELKVCEGCYGKEVQV